ncbi:hypothetical protein SAMN05444392_11722 [Seinonella peptonophila]|uniref:Cobalamin-independent methionine synthase MetE C-terminal/archaeal domain-containing protein n=1 Tax=Seinonella peptonophila TaxID=112248 RepID=A0A1M5B0Q1_9BACL|nr:hypothetical protein [Seinonella peptonophila]SHF36141.1 hypothetical protein SAMN05444392_11722 [Seinonella peptonophila]
MTPRKTLLVGSLPFKSEDEAMRQAVNVLGDTLISLPDGEIGEISEKYPLGKRSSWASYIIDDFASDQKNWQLIKKGNYEQGSPVDYDSIAKLKPKKSPVDLVRHLNFHYHEFFKQSYPIFQQLREEKKLPHLKFQVGIPTGLVPALFAMQPLQAFRYIDAMNQRLAFEVNEILAEANQDVIIQIEIPAELGLAYKLPKFLMNFALKSLFNLIHYFSTPASIGIHLCYGDLKNKALTHPQSLHKIIYFMNQIIAKWPQTHQLSYIHFPLAEGDQPPTLSDAFYQPLKELRIPQETRFIAGFVHEKRSVDELKQIQAKIDELLGYPVDIACSCGMGRRTPEVGKQLLELMKELCV